MYAGNRTASQMDHNYSKSGGKGVLDDMNRFLRKRADKMARDSEMSQINGLVNNLSRVQQDIDETMFLREKLVQRMNNDKPTSTY